MKKFNAFTLAEVLITLGIIGVVAAMTMPTLINQTNGAQYKAAYKKALSALSQAVTLNVALDDVSFADTVPGSAASVANVTEGDNQGETIASILNARMNIVDHTTDSNYATEISTNKGNKFLPADVDTYLFFNDSSMFAFKSSQSGCTADKVCEGYIDVNGKKGPNKIVECSTGNTTKDDYTAGSTGGVTATTEPCTVASPTDIYPVVFYDQTIIPATNAARAVLYGK